MIHFEVGEPHCLGTLLPTKDCPHCIAMREHTLGEILKVTRVDMGTGTITVDVQQPAYSDGRRKGRRRLKGKFKRAPRTWTITIVGLPGNADPETHWGKP